MQSQEGHLSESHCSCFSFSLQLQTGSITVEQQAQGENKQHGFPQYQIPTPAPSSGVLPGHELGWWAAAVAPGGAPQ